MIAGTLGLFKQLVPDPGLLRSSAIVLVGDSTARLLGFLFSVAAARLLMPAGYGSIAYALAVAAIVSVLTTNAPAGLGRFLARHQDDPRKQDIYATNWLMVIALMLGASLTLVVPLAAVAGLGGSMLLGLMANLLGTAVFQTYREAQKGLGRFWATGMFWVLANLLQLVGILLAGALGWRSPALFLTIYGLSSLGALAVMQPLAPTALNFAPAVLALRQIVAIARFIWPVILQGVFYTVWSGVDLILVQRLLPSAATGNYAAAKTLVLVLILAPVAVSTALGPRMARLSERSLRAYVLFVVALTAAINVPAGASMALLRVPLIALFFGSRYPLASEAVAVLVLGQVLYGVYLVLASIWTWGLGRPQIDPVATGAAMGVTVAVGLILIPRAGLAGAAYAYAAGAAAQLAVISSFTTWAIYAGAKPRIGQGKDLVLDLDPIAGA
ncbi:MAG: oligosaccharide flippase family protein [Candidatus Dormibacteraeota bacterium]|nr:oligosaccharide flippase family protein [Candidatus Dormibacteraeota bacterium]